MVKKIKVYGERNTNTNFLEQLIRLNLDVTQMPGVVPPLRQNHSKSFAGKGVAARLVFCRNPASEPGVET